MGQVHSLVGAHSVIFTVLLRKSRPKETNTNTCRLSFIVADHHATSIFTKKTTEASVGQTSKDSFRWGMNSWALPYLTWYLTSGARSR